MNNSTLGLENEIFIIKELNGKKINETSDNFRYMLLDMFKNYPKNSVLDVRKVPHKYLCKTDIEIHVQGTYENVSIKTGFSPAVHQEEFESFMLFLKELKISKKTLNFIRFYHYADETYDGSGTKTLRLVEFWEKYAKQIKEASEELSNPLIVKAVLYRCVIKGKRDTLQNINYLYYGDHIKGVFVHRNDLLTKIGTLENRDVPYLHIGPFKYVQKIFRSQVVDGRYVQYTQMCWPYIKEDMIALFKQTWVYKTGRVPLLSLD